MGRRLIKVMPTLMLISVKTNNHESFRTDYIRIMTVVVVLATINSTVGARKYIIITSDFCTPCRTYSLLYTTLETSIIGRYKCYLRRYLYCYYCCKSQRHCCARSGVFVMGRWTSSSVTCSSAIFILALVHRIRNTGCPRAAFWRLTSQRFSFFFFFLPPHRFTTNNRPNTAAAAADGQKRQKRYATGHPVDFIIVRSVMFAYYFTANRSERAIIYYACDCLSYTPSRVKSPAAFTRV